MCVASLFHLGFLLCLSIMDLHTSWACPLLAHGHESVRPILQGPSGFIFVLFSCPLHPIGLSSLRGRTKWGDGSKFMGWQFQRLWVDGSNAYGLTVLMRMLSTVQTSDRLSVSHYGAWHVSSFDWFLSRIKASLRLPCTSPINTRVYLSHFFIFSWNILSKCIRHPCQRLPCSFHYINSWHTPSVHLIYSSLTHFLRS